MFNECDLNLIEYAINETIKNEQSNITVFDLTELLYKVQELQKNK